MPTVPKGAKQPTDHKSPAISDDCFTFEHGGKSFTSKPITDILTVAFVRGIRRSGEVDMVFTMLELLFEDTKGAIDAFDAMSWAEFNDLSESLQAAMKDKVGANTGE